MNLTITRKQSNIPSGNASIILMDREEVGTLQDDESLSLDVEYGSHILKLKTKGMNDLVHVFQIRENVEIVIDFDVNTSLPEYHRILGVTYHFIPTGRTF